MFEEDLTCMTMDNSKKLRLEDKVNEMTKRMNIDIVETDNHYGLHSEANADILYQFVQDYKKDIKRVINLGDEIDNPFMSDFAVKPEYFYTAQEEWDMFGGHVKNLFNIVGKNLKYVLIAGNHSLSRLNNKRKMNRGIASLRALDYKNIVNESLKHEGVDVKQVKVSTKPVIIKYNKDKSAIFTHGDPRLDRNIKGGVTGVRRTGEMYPFNGDIYMGHGHRFIDYPRSYEGSNVRMIGMMADKKKMAGSYLSFHPYECGFGIILYNKFSYFYKPIKIINNKAVIFGKVYTSKK